MDKIPVEIDADLRDLIPGYLENRRKDIEEIEGCLSSADFASIQRLAHRMKGSGGGYGFDGITEIGAAMEQAAKMEDEVKVRDQLELLKDYLIKVVVTYV